MSSGVLGARCCTQHNWALSGWWQCDCACLCCPQGPLQAGVLLLSFGVSEDGEGHTGVSSRAGLHTWLRAVKACTLQPGALSPSDPEASPGRGEEAPYSVQALLQMPREAWHLGSGRLNFSGSRGQRGAGRTWRPRGPDQRFSWRGLCTVRVDGGGRRTQGHLWGAHLLFHCPGKCQQGGCRWFPQRPRGSS